MIKIQSYQEHDLPHALKILEKSDSTPRTPETWRGNDMTAVLAFDQEDLVGIIPFERRELVFGPNQTIPVLWASGVHVEPSYRGQGVGSAMDAKISEFFSQKAQAVLVFRQDEGSDAYRWYKKMGYHNLVSILAYRKDIASHFVVSKYRVWYSPEDILGQGQNLWECFQRHNQGFVGYPKRHPRFWFERLAQHYYKAFYRYYVLTVMDGETVVSYAFLGRTSMRDDIDRFDILEFVSASDQNECNKLLHAVEDFAERISLKEIRLQVAQNDPLLTWINAAGFTLRWNTNILGKWIDPATENSRGFLLRKETFTEKPWRYFHVDYV